ncbi:MAG: caspase family protein, partial [Hyphomicrobiaceae bacterium]
MGRGVIAAQRQFLVLLIFVGLIACLVARGAIAQPRKAVALVIGNSDYRHTTSLSSPYNDAKLFGSTLSSLGFDVIVETDLGRKAMQVAIRSYLAKLDSNGPNTIGLVYYAGHGVQVEGINYLIPIDANIDREGDVAIESISASDLLAGLRLARNNLNIVILDACRNNPFRGFARNATRGLARLDAPKGSYVLFATAPGDVAVYGDNSPFTRALAHYFATPGLTIEQIIKRVGRTVSKATADRQMPWLSSSVYEDYFPAGHGTAKSTTTIPNRTAGSLSVTKSLELESNQPIELATAQSRTDVFRDCPSGPEMVRIPAGNFRMGSLNTRFSDRNQRPSRDIIIPKPFAVGRFEVTF